MSVLFGLRTPLRAFDAFLEPPFEPIPIEHRHLTLVFIGEIRPGAIALLKRALEQAAASTKPFVLDFDRLEPFPSASGVRYLVAIPRPHPRLLELRKAIIRVLTAYGVRPEDRYEDFRPHVTLARLRAKRSLAAIELAIRLSHRARGVKESIMIRELCLFEARGGELRVIDRRPLGQRVGSGGGHPSFAQQ